MDRILIVDDDVTFALMLSTWLSTKGFRVATASSACLLYTSDAADD